MPDRTPKRNLSRRAFLQIGAASAGIFLLEAGQPAAPKAAEPTKRASPKRGGTFTLARTAGYIDFNPFNLATGHWASTRSLYNTLAYYDLKLNPQPDLAESWKIAEDGRSITVKLRQGVKFHSGKDFTSEDVKNSAEFASTDPSVYMRTLFTSIKQVDTPDKYTAVIQFKSVYPGAMDLLDQLWIIDKDAIKNFPKQANGTGAYKIDKYVPNDRLELLPFKDYWIKDKQYVDRYVVRQIPDPGALAMNLESGAIDAMWRCSVLDAARLKQQPDKYNVTMGAPGQGMFDVAVNVKWGPFQNKKVRQAIAWSVDRARFCRTAMQGLLEPTCLMWPSHTWAHFKDLEGAIGYDLDKARTLLKEAGFDKGFDVEIISSSNRVYGFKYLAEILQADLKKIGINAKVVDLEPVQYESRMNKGDFQLMVHNYGRSNRDPGTMVTAAKAWYTDKEGGWSHYANPEYDKLRQDLQSTLDRDKRKAICRQIQLMMLDECFTIVVAPQPTAWVWHTYVKDLRYDLENSPFVHELWLDK